MRFKGLQDGKFHRFYVFHYLIVPEPQDLVTLALQPIGASCIVGLLARMLASIHLDDQASLEACKVDNIPAYRVLSTEPVPIHLVIAEVCPQASLRD